jgi:hypothetical protein
VASTGFRAGEVFQERQFRRVGLFLGPQGNMPLTGWELIRGTRNILDIRVLTS